MQVPLAGGVSQFTLLPASVFTPQPLVWTPQGWMDWKINVWMDGWTCGWSNRWMDRQTDRQVTLSLESD